MRRGVLSFHLVNISLFAMRVMKAVKSFLDLDRKGTKEEVPIDTLRAFGTIFFPEISEIVSKFSGQ